MAVYQIADYLPRPAKRQGRHPHNALTAAYVRNVKPADKTKRYADGNGLYLEVRTTGTRSWVQRLVIRGKSHDMGLGGCDLVSLKEARDVALTNRKLARAGGDPLAEKQRKRGIPTLQEAAGARLDQLRQTCSAGHAGDWERAMGRWVFPNIGGLPVSEVSSADVVRTLLPIWHTRSSTARRVKQRLSEVFAWAVAMDYRTDDPCSRVGPALGPQTDKVTHMTALPHSGVAGVIQRAHGSKAQPAAKLAFEFLVLTAARSGEVRGALWSEVDTDRAVWTIPADRMKAGREHRVPLSKHALDILTAARALDGGSSPLVFPSKSGKVLHDSQLSALLKRMGVAAVPHGFRSSFRDWAAETVSYDRAVMEAALAHAEQDKTVASYARTDYLEQRRPLMVAWADYVTQ